MTDPPDVMALQPETDHVLSNKSDDARFIPKHNEVYRNEKKYSII